MPLSLFVSIFFECSLSENKFSPFWVYSQWNKLNLIGKYATHTYTISEVLQQLSWII